MEQESQHVEEKSRMWKVPEREAYAGSLLSRKHLKTTSEWPQSGPVIPLSSNEVVPAEMPVQSGWNRENICLVPFAERRRERGFSFCIEISFPGNKKARKSEN